tara:strand:- start:66 stop:167 length:102 start_codon:yes stop_codon:yes gene_type:complete
MRVLEKIPIQIDGRVVPLSAGMSVSAEVKNWSA